MSVENGVPKDSKMVVILVDLKARSLKVVNWSYCDQLSHGLSCFAEVWYADACMHHQKMTHVETGT